MPPCNLCVLRLGKCGIIDPFLLRVWGHEVKDQARSSAAGLPVPIMARASRRETKGRPRSVRHPGSPCAGRAELLSRPGARPAPILTHLL